MTALKTRQPTGVVPYPVVLVEGEEKSGKSYAAALLSASEKVGRTFWIDLGEGAADEYGAIPGVRYEIVEHNGDYAEILAAVLAVKEEAARAKAAGEPPTVLVIDSMTDVWEGLKDWTSERARGSERNKAKLRQDPNAEVDIPMNLWNDASARHRKIVTALLTFPGIVVLTAKGKEATDVKDGKPVANQKVWKVEGQKNLAFDATVWVRLTRSDRPTVIGARSVHVGLVPGKDKPEPITADPDNLLEWLIFDVLKVDASAAQARDLKPLTGGELTEDEKAEELSRPPEGREPAQRQKRQGKPAQDEFTASAVTDQDWLEGWLKKVDDATDDQALTDLYAEAGAKVRDGQLTDADAELAKTAVASRHDVLAKQADKQGAWSDVEVAKVPGGGAAA